MPDSQKDWSPFQPTRFEHLSKPVIWLPPSIATLEGSTNVYLPGSRGTGKTTLLKALNFHLRMSNDSLARQLPEGPFRTRYIGLYLRLPDFVISKFYGPALLSSYRIAQANSGALTATENDETVRDTYHHAFSLLLELQILQLLTSALASMRDAGHIQVTREREVATVREVLSAWPALNPGRAGLGRAESFRALRLVFRSYHEEIQRRSFGAGVDFDLSDLPVSQLGSLLSEAATILLGAINDTQPWRLKVCFDEAECLFRWQQLVLNSLVRLATAPVSYVIAYVRRDYETVDTLIPHLKLSNADRIVHRALEESPRRDYEQLVQNVVRLYLQNAQPPEAPPLAFDLDTFLGPTRINTLLLRSIEKNKTTRSLALLSSAKRLAMHPFFSNVDRTNAVQRADPAPPIYQTYLTQKLSLQLPDSTAPWKRRQQESAELRKRMVAAYLVLHNEFHWKPLFAGKNVAYHMSTNCIRDFLDEMHYLYLQTNCGRDVTRLVALGELSAERQSAGFAAAAANKRSVIATEAPFRRGQVGNLVKCLGRLLHILQADHRAREALASPERGQFRLRHTTEDDRSYDLCQSYVQDAVDAGALKLYLLSSGQTVFGLHRLLAPEFGFSYRKPQYAVELDPWLLLTVVEAVDDDAFQRAFRELVAAMQRNSVAIQQALEFQDRQE